MGHRVVHGGQSLQQTSRITTEVQAGIRKYAEFAPEHNRLELEAIEAAERMLGASTPSGRGLRHRVPRDHAGGSVGLSRSIRLVSSRASAATDFTASAINMYRAAPPRFWAADRRTPADHLSPGQRSSLAAVRDGLSIDTTMGFTPLEGLMMGTRSGSLDPGILVYLVRHTGMDAPRLDACSTTNRGSKACPAFRATCAKSWRPRPMGVSARKLAFDVYVHRLCREIGAMVASLGGLDALVFTAGVGENSPEVRERVCDQLRFLGIELDGKKNAGFVDDSDVATQCSRLRVLVIRTDEDWEIARECWRILQ